jgi:hypothetical protein
LRNGHAEHKSDGDDPGPSRTPRHGRVTSTSPWQPALGTRQAYHMRVRFEHEMDPPMRPTTGVGGMASTPSHLQHPFQFLRQHHTCKVHMQSTEADMTHHDDKALRQTVANMVRGFHERGPVSNRERLARMQTRHDRRRGRNKITLPKVSILLLLD